MNDYQDELTAKRRDAIWKQIQQKIREDKLKVLQFPGKQVKPLWRYRVTRLLMRTLAYIDLFIWDYYMAIQITIAFLLTIIGILAGMWYAQHQHQQ